MTENQNTEDFSDRFRTREQVEQYRDRYTTGRRRRVHLKEVAALKRLLAGVGPVETALDLPCGSGRLSPLLAEVAGRIVMADTSSAMLKVAREDHPDLNAQYLLTHAERIDLESASVDVVFSHRLLHHVRDRALRAGMLGELVRVSRRYVILSYYPSGLRTRLRWRLRRLFGMVAPGSGPVFFSEFLAETRLAGLRLVRSTILRNFPKAQFCLFERGP